MEGVELKIYALWISMSEADSLWNFQQHILVGYLMILSQSRVLIMVAMSFAHFNFLIIPFSSVSIRKRRLKHKAK